MVIPINPDQGAPRRRLWEAAERCQAGEAVVGVVGAARVPAVRREWPRAGAPEVARTVRRYPRPSP